MPPAHSRTHDASSMSFNGELPDFPAPPTANTSTPQHTSEKNLTGITQAQKQALIDNLQLEIAERARKLRAQYALQARGLRARLEMRVNRIPSALRKRNIQELVDEHTAKANPVIPPPVPVTQKAAAPQVVNASKQPLKRKSDEISTGDDKENLPSDAAEDLANPKKRSKTTTVVANSKATRTTSRKPGPAGVLSPKSHNSRTWPKSPIKYSPPSKAPPARTMGAAQTVTAKKSTTRAPSRQTKRGGGPPSEDGRTSEASNSSAGTTIITKPGTRKAAIPKKAAAKGATTARKTVASKVEAAPPAGGGRTLRKRN